MRARGCHKLGSSCSRELCRHLALDVDPNLWEVARRMEQAGRPSAHSSHAGVYMAGKWQRRKREGRRHRADMFGGAWVYGWMISSWIEGRKLKKPCMWGPCGDVQGGRTTPKHCIALNPCPTHTQRHYSPCDNDHNPGRTLPALWRGTDKEIFLTPAWKFTPMRSQTQDLSATQSI